MKTPLTLLIVTLLCCAGCKKRNECVDVHWQTDARDNLSDSKITGNTTMLLYGTISNSDFCSKHGLRAEWHVEMNAGEYVGERSMQGIIYWTGDNGVSDSVVVELESEFETGKLQYGGSTETLLLDTVFNNTQGAITTAVRFYLSDNIPAPASVDQQHQWIMSHFPHMHCELFYKQCNDCE